MFEQRHGLSVWIAPWEEAARRFGIDREEMAAGRARVVARRPVKGSVHAPGSFTFPHLRNQDDVGEDYTLLTRDADTGAGVSVGSIFLEGGDTVIVEHLDGDRWVFVKGESASFRRAA